MTLGASLGARRVALVGVNSGVKRAERDGLVSVKRTGNFFLEAVRRGILAEHVELADGPVDWSRFNGVVDFSYNFITSAVRPNLPIAFFMHGAVARGLGPYMAHPTRLRRYDQLVVTCQSDRSIVESVFGAAGPQPFVLPCAVDTTFFRPLSREECRSRHGLPLDALVLGYVCRLYPQKNLHRFLDLLSEVRRARPNREVVGLVFGEFKNYPIVDWYQNLDYGAYIAALTRRLKLESAVTWRGFAPEDDSLLTGYNAMDVLIHPTNAIDENFGLTPIEALSAGVPVLGCAWGGVKDTVVSGKQGMLMPTWWSETGVRCDYEVGIDYLLSLSDSPGTAGDNRSDCRAGAVRFSEDAFFQRLSQLVTTLTNGVDDQPACDPCQPKVDPQFGWSHVRPELPEVMSAHWKSLRPFATIYAGSPAPKLTAHSRLRAFAEMRFDAAKELWVSDDPCWPATFRLSSLASAFLTKCNGIHRVTEIAGLLGLNVNDILPLAEELLTAGAIVASVGSANATEPRA